MIGLWNVVLVFADILLVAAGVGWLLDQPSYVLRALGGSGGLIGAIFLIRRRLVIAGYQEAQLPKTIAADL